MHHEPEWFLRKIRTRRPSINLSVNRIFNIAVLTAFAGAGLMQAAEQAAFHLPVTAHWGQVVLQPGDYKMSLPALRLERAHSR